jgi:predicted kinase
VDDLADALVLMVGPPGSGKSTWVGRRFRPDDVFSLDRFRWMLTGEPLCMDATDAARTMLHTAVAYRMGRGLTTVVDATNSRRAVRAPLIAAASLHAVPVLAVVMGAPLEVCEARNDARDGVSAPYPGANATPVPAGIVAGFAYEIQKEPPRVGEVDAILTVGADGTSVEWQGGLPAAVLAAPWLADALEAPARCLCGGALKRYTTTEEAAKVGNLGQPDGAGGWWMHAELSNHVPRPR